MTILHRAASSADLDPLRSMLDQEFIFGKGRTMSLVQRFPSAFCAANAGNIFLSVDEGKIVSAFLVKSFDWQHGAKVWRGAMIGAVYTDPQRRGEGLAGNLLKWGTQRLRETDTEFGVLWTNQSAFYAKLGWIGADLGVFGSGTPPTDIDITPDAITVAPLGMSDGRGIDAIRQRYLDSYVRRRPLDYQQVPLPAESVEMLLCEEHGEPSGYALLGRKGEVDILYEMVGSEAGFPNLWHAIRQRHRQIMVNDCVDSPSHRWLVQHTDIAWENKMLAMWLPLSNELDIAQMGQWYIPYFDRI